jgi:sorbitol-specific phosphotransferase system component IIC
MKVKKWYIIPAIVIIVLMVTNPSERSFGKYINSNKDTDYRMAMRKENNFILFSIFKAESLFEQQEYIGVFGFFIRTKNRTIF